MNELEVWRDIKGFEGLYQVSNAGNVKSFVKYSQGKLMVGHARAGGYLGIKLTKDSIGSQLQISRLVAEAFIPNPDNLPEVNHKDEDRQNNHAWNLEWCTHQYNSNYGSRTAKMKKALIGTNLETGEKVHFSSIIEASNQGMGHRVNISKCCRGQKKSYHGYTWEFDI